MASMRELAANPRLDSSLIVRNTQQISGPCRWPRSLDAVCCGRLQYLQHPEAIAAELPVVACSGRGSDRGVSGNRMSPEKAPSGLGGIERHPPPPPPPYEADSPWWPVVGCRPVGASTPSSPKNPGNAPARLVGGQGPIHFSPGRQPDGF